MLAPRCSVSCCSKITTEGDNSRLNRSRATAIGAVGKLGLLPVGAIIAALVNDAEPGDAGCR